MSREDYEKLMDEFRQVVAGTKFENCIEFDMMDGFRQVVAGTKFENYIEFDMCDDFFIAEMKIKDGEDK